MRFIATIASRRSPSVALRARTTASVEPAYNKTLLLEWSVVVRYEIFGRWCDTFGAASHRAVESARRASRTIRHLTMC